MADQTTSWILELVDRVTKPVKSMMATINDMTDSVEDMGDAVRMSEKDTSEALANSKSHYKELEGQIKAVEKEMKELERQKKSGNWNEQMQASKAFEAAEARLVRLRGALQGADEDVRDLTAQVDRFNTASQKWTDLATGINQGVELIQKATDGLDFNVDVSKLTKKVKMMTGLNEDMAATFVKNSRRIADVYDEDAEDIARAVHIMTRNLGGSYEDNFAIMEEGFKKGANLGGNLVGILEKQSGALASIGLDAQTAMAMMIKASKDGLDPESVISSVVNAGNAITEMGVKQQKALEGIGLKVEDLAGKTAWEAIQTVSQAMEGMSSQARQTVLTRVFGAAGKDSGLAFAQGLADGIPSLDQMPEVQQAGSGFKAFFSEIKTWAGQALGDVGIYVQTLSPMIQLIAGAIPIMQMLSKVTWIQTAAAKVATIAQWAWNAAMTANPIGIIIVAIGALVGAIVWLVSMTEGWGQAWEHTWNAAKYLFMAWVKTIQANFNLMINGLMIGINKIKEGWYKFKEAVGLGDSDENKRMLAEIEADTEARKDSIKQAYEEAADYAIKAADEIKQAGQSIKMKKGDEKEASPSVNKYATADAEKLSFNQDDEGKKGKGKKEGSGLNVGTGSGGIKSITMTLNITNQFSVDKGSDMRSIADKIVGHVNDRLRDSVINLGA